LDFPCLTEGRTGGREGRRKRWRWQRWVPVGVEGRREEGRRGRRRVRLEGEEEEEEEEGEGVHAWKEEQQQRRRR
jgi:hypothetical protein